MERGGGWGVVGVHAPHAPHLPHNPPLSPPPPHTSTTMHTTSSCSLLCLLLLPLGALQVTWWWPARWLGGWCWWWSGPHEPTRRCSSMHGKHDNRPIASYPPVEMHTEGPPTHATHATCIIHVLPLGQGTTPSCHPPPTRRRRRRVCCTACIALQVQGMYWSSWSLGATASHDAAQHRCIA